MPEFYARGEMYVHCIKKGCVLLAEKYFDNTCGYTSTFNIKANRAILQTL